MRVFLSVSMLAAISVAAATFACSASEPVAPVVEDAGAATPSTTSEQTGGPPPASSSEVPGTNAPTDGGTTGDTGTGMGTGGGNGGTTGDAGRECDEDSIREKESNNDIATANVLEAKTSSFCGQLTKDDPDHIKIKMPEREFAFGFRPSVRGRGDFEVQVLDLDGNRANIRRLEGGKEYIFKLIGTGALDYKIEFSFE